jgi:hypothetical protein
MEFHLLIASEPDTFAHISRNRLTTPVLLLIYIRNRISAEAACIAMMSTALAIAQ